MKRGTPNHPKAKLLAIELSMPAYAVVGILESLWHFCAEFTPDGAIGKYTDSYLAAHIGWTGDAKALIKALVKTGWLDKSKTHRLIVHHWSQHADDMVHAKLFRAQNLFADDKKPNPSRITKEERERIVRESEGARGHGMPPPGALPDPALPAPMPLPDPALPGAGANGNGERAKILSGRGEGELGKIGDQFLKRAMLKQHGMESDKAIEYIARLSNLSSVQLKAEIDRMTADGISSIAGALYKKFYNRDPAPPRRGPVREDC